MDAPPLIVSLSVADVSIGHKSSHVNGTDSSGSTSHPVQTACAASSSTFLASWPLDLPGRSGLAVAMGCDDGSSYIFWPAKAPPPPSLPPATTVAPILVAPKPVALPNKAYPPSPVSSRHLKSPSPTPSRSSWSTSLHVHSHPPSIVAPRSTIVTSSLSKAQVEAPKTFVDYDDEPDYLRSMLKTNRTDVNNGRRAPSDRTPTASGSTSPTTIMEDPSSPSRELAQLTSPDVGRPPVATHRASSRKDVPPLELRMRLLPPRVGFGHGVVSLKTLEGGNILACLQASGSLSLFSPTDGRCLASSRIDELPRIKPPSNCKPVPEAQGYYKWKNMRVAQDGESTLLFLAAEEVTQVHGNLAEDVLPCPDLRITVVRVKSHHERAFTSSPEEILEKVGDWISDGPAACFGLHLDDQGDLSMYRINKASRFVLQTIQFLPHPPSPSPSLAKNLPANDSSSFLPLPISQSFTQFQQQLKLPNPFKSSSHGRSKSRHFSRFGSSLQIPSHSGTSSESNLEAGRVELGDEIDLGSLECEDINSMEEITGVSIGNFGSKVMGCIWTEEQCIIFRLGLKREPLYILTDFWSDGIQNVCWLDAQSLAVTTADDVRLFSLKTTDFNNDEVKTDNWFLERSADVVHQADMTQTIGTEGIQTSSILSSSLLLLSSHDPNEETTSLSTIAFPTTTSENAISLNKSPSRSRKLRSRALWKRAADPPQEKHSPRIQSVLPLGHELVLLGLDDGQIAKASLEELIVDRHVPATQDSKSRKGLSAPILSLDHIRNSRTGERFVIGSSFDGSLAVWNLKDLELRARWTVFATPLLSVIDLTDEENVGQLKDCLLCVAEHGTIAVILIDGLQFQYLIPGANCPLERICLGDDNLLLIYCDGKARLWDVKTQEFWRSMTKAKAEALLEQGGWFEVYVEQEGPRFNGDSPFGSPRNASGGSDTILVDIREAIRTGLSSVTSSSEAARLSNPNLDSTTIAKAWAYLHPILVGFLAVRIDSDFDEMCLSLLGSAPPSQIPLWGTASFKGAIAFPAQTTDGATWTNTPEYTSTVLLSILSLLKAASAFEEWDSVASQISIYLTSSLSVAVGPSYSFPSLEVLTQHWFDPCAEVKQAARSLFATTMQGYTEKEACNVVDEWRHRLPSVQPDSLKDAQYAAVSLLVTGHVAAEHYASIPTETLTDIAKSVALYLHDESSPHRVLAIELCSAGFHVWQHYVDAVNVLRQLFDLATSSKTAAGSGGVGPQARAAVLQIASTNTPLFMTTLSMDIANPSSLEHRKSVMQLIAFIIRKKPLVLYPNLTRLVEAVVKSLDPNSASSREAVLDPAVEILGHVVRTFPTVDFQKQTQRLALGTNEGAVIMYDLKTATRLYVLEGHKKRTTAISFSPDGRRLVTASLDDSMVLVWKVGSSFSSFFNPGAPPRQGGSGSEAYKSLPFNVGDEAHMTVASTLDWVAFEWPSERTARLKIRDSILTFDVT